MNKLFFLTIFTIGCTIVCGRIFVADNDGMVGGLEQATAEEVKYLEKVLIENVHLIKNVNLTPNPLM